MRIEEKFRELREKGEGAYMPHIYYGDPSEEFSLRAVKVLAESGADFIEFGIPFSDPTADGPTFQASCERALDNGTTPEDCIEGIEILRNDGLRTPIIVTIYYNIPYIRGLGDFLGKLRDAGAQGVIVPNVPLEEAGPLIEAGDRSGIDVILQVTPNTSEERLEEIATNSSGFLYVVNVEGVTGVRESVPHSTVNLMRAIREKADIPLMAGFGVSKKKHAKNLVSAGADGVITGSALGEIYSENLDNPKEKLDDMSEFASRIKEGSVLGYGR